MPVPPGTRLGAYEVLSALGAGGMGEVYRARDTKLGRDVALKVLPAEFAQERDRLRLRVHLSNRRLGPPRRRGVEVRARYSITA
jgi:serine/threonine protein kinase